MIPNKNEAHAAHVHELIPILFELNSPEAAAVFVAGSFNEWSSQASPLTRSPTGRWKKETTLAPGAYEYCLVVDGRWILDPLNQVSVVNPYGGRNSVLTVAESAGGAHLIDAELKPFQVVRKHGPVGEMSSDGAKQDWEAARTKK